MNIYYNYTRSALCDSTGVIVADQSRYARIVLGFKPRIDFYVVEENETTGVVAAKNLNEIVAALVTVDKDLNSSTPLMALIESPDIDLSDIENGHLSFKLNANTTAFSTGLSSATSLVVTMYIVGFDIIAEKKEFFEFSVIAKNWATPDDEDPLEEIPSNYYNKAEIVALQATKLDKLFSSSATLTDNTANAITLGSISSYQAITIKGYIRNAAGSVNYFSGAVYHNGTTAENNIKLTDFGGAFITGVTFPFTADISGDNLRLIITLSGAGENLTMKYGIENYIGV